MILLTNDKIEQIHWGLNDLMQHRGRMTTDNDNIHEEAEMGELQSEQKTVQQNKTIKKTTRHVSCCAK